MAGFDPLRVLVIDPGAFGEVLLGEPLLFPEALQVFSQDLECGHPQRIAILDHTGHRRKLRCSGLND